MDWAIFLNGSYGVGKSTTLDHIGNLLGSLGQPFSLMDVDWYHRSWPPADAADGGNKALEAANMAAVWANYQRVAPRQLVISGVVASQQDVARYEAALGLHVRPVRLVASPSTIERRLRSRYTATQAHVYDWHARRHLDLSSRLAAADVDEATIDTDTLSPYDTALAVLAHFGYPSGAGSGGSEATP